jgi:glycosyltransferase involved in cell wall biosynthesis
MKNLKLGFHTHIPAINKEGKIYMPGHIGFFVDGLAELCEEVLCFQHFPKKFEMEQMDYEIKSPNVTLVSMGPHLRIPIRTVMGAMRGFVVKKYLNELDLILIRTPTPLLPLFSFWSKKKIVLFIVGDYLSGIESLRLPRWKKVLIGLWSKWIDYIQMQVAKENMAFVNGKHLYEKLKDRIPKIAEIRTTTLRENDFFLREDTCLSPPFRLLYCGRIIKEKGIFDLFEAFLKLKNEGFDVVMDLVGAVEPRDNTLEELLNMAKEKRVEKSVFYYGYQPAGEKLLSFYRKADIFVCPTQIVSETYPRTIREAMASSVPVVATCVGSLPYYIGDCSLLVSPKDVESLAKAIENLIVDKTLRKNLIQRGMEVVKKDTIEFRSKELIDIIDKEFFSNE